MHGCARADLESEMPVVRNEMEGGENDGFTILLQRMAATAYLWHNYGKDTIGARSDVEHVDINRLRAFYQRYYQPDNAVLVIAGRFDEARAKQWVAQSFGALPKPARKLPRLYTREPQQDGEREVTLRRAGDTQLLGALYHVPDGAHPGQRCTGAAVASAGRHAEWSFASAIGRKWPRQRDFRTALRIV
jgi:zinc protease